MRITPGIANRIMLLITVIVSLTLFSSRLQADTGTCGGASISLPFTDVPSSNIFFCSIAEAFFSGLTNGTSATTYNPSDPVPREQMAAFVSRTLDQSLERGSRRAALKQFWTPQSDGSIGRTTVGTTPRLARSDGADIWVANDDSGTVSRVRASDGKLLETWTGATSAYGVLIAAGKVFITGRTMPGSLYQIDPTQPAGAVTTLTTSLGVGPRGIAFDGTRIWTSDLGSPSSVSIITLNPLTVMTVATGFVNLRGILYDGSNMWVMDEGENSLKKLDSNGAILQTIAVGSSPEFAAFDGTNIWVPNAVDSSVTVVRVSTGVILATLSGNGLDVPNQAAFDGERILVTNQSTPSASLWKASDLTPLGSSSLFGGPFGVCSDGLNFWITLKGSNKLARF